MKRTGRVLVIDDQPQVAELLARLAPDLDLIEVREGGPSRRFARSWSEAAPLLEGRRAPEVVVLDVRFDLPDEDLLPDTRPLGDTAASKRLRRERRERQGLGSGRANRRPSRAQTQGSHRHRQQQRVDPDCLLDEGPRQQFQGIEGGHRDKTERKPVGVCRGETERG